MRPCAAAAEDPVSPRPAARSMGRPPNPASPKGLARAAAADDAIAATTTAAAARSPSNVETAGAGAGAGATATEIMANEQSNLDYIALAAMGVLLAGPGHSFPLTACSYRFTRTHSPHPPQNSQVELKRGSCARPWL